MTAGSILFEGQRLTIPGQVALNERTIVVDTFGFRPVAEAAGSAVLDDVLPGEPDLLRGVETEGDVGGVNCPTAAVPAVAGAGDSESDTRVHYSKTDWSGPSMSIFGDVSLLFSRTTESVVGASECHTDCNHRNPYTVLGTGLYEGISPVFPTWDLKLGY